MITVSLVIPQKIAAQAHAIIAEDAKLIKIADNFEFTEGPAVDSRGNVYFTDQPNDQILKLSVGGELEVFLTPSGRSNGLYFDTKDNLYACADALGQIWKIDANKNIQVLLKDFQGKRLNGPNDLWIDPKGGIYFTDPFYQRSYWEHTSPYLSSENVYYLSPKGTTKIVATGLDQPNGIIGTPDGSLLYVADIGRQLTYNYQIGTNGNLSNQKLFVAMGSDGMTIDEQGNVYLTGDGVSVFDSTAKKIEHIKIDEPWTANVTFGGPDRDILFITASKAIYRLAMKVKGN
ncbi:MAG: gluconolactonase [Flammeovirgaceae bacterium]|nr:gluconolactonase [Flammeovirgaceae bacterium]